MYLKDRIIERRSDREERYSIPWFTPQWPQCTRVAVSLFHQSLDGYKKYMRNPHLGKPGIHNHLLCFTETPLRAEPGCDSSIPAWPTVSVRWPWLCLSSTFSLPPISVLCFLSYKVIFLRAFMCVCAQVTALQTHISFRRFKLQT